MIKRQRALINVFDRINQTAITSENSHHAAPVFDLYVKVPVADQR